MSHVARAPGTFIDSLALLALAAFSVWLGWSGYHGVDALPYSIAAGEWVSQGPHVGTNHWALRLPHVLPIAASFSLWGTNDISLVLPTMIYFFTLVLITYVAVRGGIDRATGVITAALVAVTPGFANGASLANPELTELFFAAGSVWLFYHAGRQSTPHWLLFGAGVAAGLAWLTRETSASVLLLYGLLFVFGYRFARRHYILLGAGFLVVAGSEILAYAGFTGDPLYRLHTDLAHGDCTPAAGTLMTTEAMSRGFSAPFGALVNAGTAVLYICAVVGGSWLALRRSVSPPQKAALILFVLLALIHFLFIGYGLGFKVLSRYYLVSTYGAAVLAGIGLGALYGSRSFRPAVAVIGLALISTGLFVTALRGFDRAYGARALAHWVSEHDAPVYTDLATRRVSTFFFLDRPALTRRVRSDPPPQGALYFMNGPHAVKKALGRAGALMLPDPAEAGWTQVWRANPDPGKGVRLIESLQMESLLPAKTLAWLRARRAPVVVYRVSATALSAAQLGRQWESDDTARPARCDPWLTVN